MPDRNARPGRWCGLPRRHRKRPVPSGRIRPDGNREFDPTTLLDAVARGAACVMCGKVWPSPRVRVGVQPDGGPVMACRSCSHVITPALPPLAELVSAPLVDVVTALVSAAAWYAVKGPVVLVDGQPSPWTVIHAAGGTRHTTGHTACSGCSVTWGAVYALASHLVDEDQEPPAAPLPRAIRTRDDARLVIEAWAADAGGLPGEDVVAALYAVAARLDNTRLNGTQAAAG